MIPVLVAEDETWIRNAIVEMVHRIGDEANRQYKVVGAAENGEEAWSLIEEVWPLIVIIDIQMPKMDGLAVARKIYEQKLPIAVIIVSGFDCFRYAQAAISFGVIEYILKPIHMNELKKALFRTEDYLQSFRSMNGYLKMTQDFLHNMRDKEAVYLFRKLEDTLDSIFKLYDVDRIKEFHLLKMFETKMIKLLEEAEINVPHLCIAMDTREELVIRRRFKGLLKLWISV